MAYPSSATMVVIVAINAFVTDNSAWLFTETQVQELCDLCVAGGAGVPPSCPGAPPPVAKGLPRCSFADAILARDETNVLTDCTGTVQARMPGKVSEGIKGILDFWGKRFCEGIMLSGEKLFDSFPMLSGKGGIWRSTHLSCLSAA